MTLNKNQRFIFCIVGLLIAPPPHPPSVQVCLLMVHPLPNLLSFFTHDLFVLEHVCFAAFITHKSQALGLNPENPCLFELGPDRHSFSGNFNVSFELQGFHMIVCMQIPALKLRKLNDTD